MQSMQAFLAAVEDVTLHVSAGTAAPMTPGSIEFLSAAATLRTDAVYLLDESGLPELERRGPLPAAVFFVACAAEQPPALPAEAPGAATVVFVRCTLLSLYSRLNRCLEAQRVRSRIDDIFLLAENMNYSPEQLVLTLSQMLGIALFILDASYQRVSGAAAEFSRSPYSQELAHTGILSAESVRAVRSGREEAAFLYEVASSKWSRFHLLLLWRPGAEFDAQYLCQRMADFISDYQVRKSPPDIPPFLIDQRLNRLLEGSTFDESEIRSFFGTDSNPSWFAVLVLKAESGVQVNAEAYQRQAHMLLCAFRNISVTVVRSQVCAVVQLPIRTPQETVFSRSYFNEHAYNEGWDAQRLEHELKQCGAYLCCSPLFRTLQFFPIELTLVSDSLDIAIRLEDCRGQRIVDYHDYSPFVSIKLAVERFLQKYSPHSLRAMLYPEMVTLLLHDLKTRGDLSEVLYRYYIYGDVNRTAQSLFVHRNTVYNKLKTIQKLLNVDPDDPVVRSSFLTSLRVYYYCEKCLGLDLSSFT